MSLVMRSLLMGVLLVWSLTGLAQPVTVEGIRVWEAPDHTRVVLDLSASPQHRLFMLDNPGRVVVDLSHARMGRGVGERLTAGEVVKGVRSAARNGNDLRLVLDLATSVRPQSFTLPPNAPYGHRLVIDLHREATTGPARASTSEAAPAPSSAAPVATTPTSTVPAAAPPRTVQRLPQTVRPIIVAIDAGHGGEDPGAIGPGGTREKDVVLAIARRLERLIEADPGMRPVMIRSGDYFVPLRQRFERARTARADILISIHADAFPDPRPRGSSVYALSTRGATSEQARWLAQRENAADLVGGVNLSDKDQVLRSVLLDLSQAATIEHSLEAGNHILRELKRVGPVHKPQVEQANFAVLRAPDIPSVLVEAAFISNPAEERRLRDTRYQQQVAEAILSGVRSYFRSHPPEGTVMAQQGQTQRHVVQRGETLSTIARRYRVSVANLRAANSLSNDVIRVGDVLSVPTGG